MNTNIVFQNWSTKNAFHESIPTLISHLSHATIHRIPSPHSHPHAPVYMLPSLYLNFFENGSGEDLLMFKNENGTLQHHSHNSMRDQLIWNMKMTLTEMSENRTPKKLHSFPYSYAQMRNQFMWTTNMALKESLFWKLIDKNDSQKMLKKYVMHTPTLKPSHDPVPELQWIPKNSV